MRDQLAVTGEYDSLGCIRRYVHRDLPATVIVEGRGDEISSYRVGRRRFGRCLGVVRVGGCLVIHGSYLDGPRLLSGRSDLIGHAATSACEQHPTEPSTFSDHLSPRVPSSVAGERGRRPSGGFAAAANLGVCRGSTPLRGGWQYRMRRNQRPECRTALVDRRVEGAPGGGRQFVTVDHDSGLCIHLIRKPFRLASGGTGTG